MQIFLEHSSSFLCSKNICTSAEKNYFVLMQQLCNQEGECGTFSLSFFQSLYKFSAIAKNFASLKIGMENNCSVPTSPISISPLFSFTSSQSPSSYSSISGMIGSWGKWGGFRLCLISSSSFFPCTKSSFSQIVFCYVDGLQRTYSGQSSLYIFTEFFLKLQARRRFEKELFGEGQLVLIQYR